MDQLLIKKNNNVSNVSKNTSTTPMSSHDNVEACSVDNNHQNIENVFNEPINIARTQDVSPNTTNCTSEGTGSYFQLKDHIASFEKQLRDKQYIMQKLLRKSDRNASNYTNDIVIHLQKSVNATLTKTLTKTIKATISSAQVLMNLRTLTKKI